METGFENIENSESDKEFYKEMERRRQRRLEKRKQEKRKKLIVTILLSIGAIFIIITIGTRIAGKKETVVDENLIEETSIEESTTELTSDTEVAALMNGIQVAGFRYNEIAAEADYEEPLTEQSTEGMNTSETSVHGGIRHTNLILRRIR